MNAQDKFYPEIMDEMTDSIRLTHPEISKLGVVQEGEFYYAVIEGEKIRLCVVSGHDRKAYIVPEPPRHTDQALVPVYKCRTSAMIDLWLTAMNNEEKKYLTECGLIDI